MNRRPVVIPEGASLEAMVQLMGGSRQTEIPVVDAEGRLVGMISQAPVRKTLAEGDRLRNLVMATDLATPEPDAITGDDTALTALRRLTADAT